MHHKAEENPGNTQGIQHINNSMPNTTSLRLMVDEESIGDAVSVTNEQNFHSTLQYRTNAATSRDSGKPYHPSELPRHDTQFAEAIHGDQQAQPSCHPDSSEFAPVCLSAMAPSHMNVHHDIMGSRVETGAI